MVARSSKTHTNKLSSPKKKAAATKVKVSTNKRGKGGIPLWQQILDNAHAITVQSGQPAAPRQQVVSMCGLSKESGSFKNSLTTLKTKDYIVFDAEQLIPTDLGRENAKAVDVAKSNDEQLEIAKARVSTKGKKLIELLKDGKAHSRASIAEALKSDEADRSYKNFLSLVKKADCLEYCDDHHGQKCLRLPDWIFPFDRPE